MKSVKWWLESGEARADQWSTFEIPSYEARSRLRVGSYAKMIFAFVDGEKERMWVEVQSIIEDQEAPSVVYRGTLLSSPVSVDERILKSGAEVKFEPKHVIDIDDPTGL